MTPEQRLQEKLRLKKYTLDNIDHLKKIRKEYWDRNKDKTKNKFLVSTYGISLENYTKLSDMQLGLCAICRKPEEGTIKGILKKLAVDHCHKTKKVRGLLCNNCNMALGLFKDDENLLLSAVLYLRKNL